MSKAWFTLKDVVEVAGEILEKDPHLPKDVVEAFIVAVFKAIDSLTSKGRVVIRGIGSFNKTKPYTFRSGFVKKTVSVPARLSFKESKAFRRRG